MSLLPHQLELLSPARDADIGIEAINHGADAVYIGGPAFGARASAGNDIRDIEADRKGIPVLLRQYLKLGGKLLAFNVDKDFSDCLDGLIVVDLLQADRRQLERYMGKDGLAAFQAYHAGDCVEKCA